MARNLYYYCWDADPLNAEALCVRDQIIVEDSDVDESPQTKAERIRRREAIGRRYVLGHQPLIQTASLRGPFGGKSGWIAPWTRVKACLDDQELSAEARRHKQESVRYEIHKTAESVTLAVQGCTKLPVGEDLPHDYVDDDSMRYDADNENDTQEEINDEGVYPLQLARRLGGLRRGDSLSPSNRKRKIDDGWLKGENALKRSRYKILEHSSPTPRTGAILTLNLCSPYLQNRTTDNTNTLPDVLKGQDGISWDVTEQSTRSSLMRARQKESVDCEDSNYDNLFQDDINGIMRATHGRHISEGSVQKHQTEIIRISPLNLDITRSRALSPNQRLARRGERHVSLQGKDQHSNGQINKSSATLHAVADHAVNLTHLDDKVDFHDESSQVSEDSFQYRKVNLKSRLRKSSLYSGEIKKEIEVTRKEICVSKDDIETIQTANSTLRNSSNFIIAGNGSDFELYKEATRQIIEGESHQSRTTSPASSLDGLSEVGVSSPDPLSQDFQKENGERLAPTTGQIAGQKTTDSSRGRVATEIYPSRVVTQADPDSRQQGCKTQGSASRAVFQIPSQIEDRNNTSAGPIVAIQSKLPDSHVRTPDFPISSGDLGKPSLAQGCQLDRKSSLQSQSPVANNAPVDSICASPQTDVLTTQSATVEDITEASQPHYVNEPVVAISENTLLSAAVQGSKDRATLIQSPWTAATVESRQPDLLSDLGSNGSRYKIDNSVVGRHPQDLFTNLPKSIACTPESEEASITNSNDRDKDGCLEPFLALVKKSRRSSNKLAQASTYLPSTQTLVDAATANPWNSALKKPGRRSSAKRVSFDSIPLENVDDAADSASPDQLERMGSPPLPADTLRLRQSDDPFHYRLKATRDLEIMEGSLPNFAGIRLHKRLALTPRSNASQNSPAVVAMAEALIVADQQNCSKHISTRDTSVSMKMSGIENSMQPRVWVATEQPELTSSSPLDTSFSIAPCGRVTAVSIETPSYDTEDNLNAVIEEMGSFLEGWDVESELKKVKGQNVEKADDRKTTRKRECLSGLSNR